MAQIITKVPKEALGEGKDTERQRCSTIPYRPTSLTSRSVYAKGHRPFC